MTEIQPPVVTLFLIISAPLAAFVPPIAMFAVALGGPLILGLL